MALSLRRVPFARTHSMVDRQAYARAVASRLKAFTVAVTNRRQAYAVRRSLPGLTDSADYALAQKHFSSVHVWKFFDGDSMSLRIAHKCIDRHGTWRTSPASQ